MLPKRGDAQCHTRHWNGLRNRATQIIILRAYWDVPEGVFFQTPLDSMDWVWDSVVVWFVLRQLNALQVPESVCWGRNMPFRCPNQPAEASKCPPGARISRLKQHNWMPFKCPNQPAEAAICPSLASGARISLLRQQYALQVPESACWGSKSIFQSKSIF